MNAAPAIQYSSAAAANGQQVGGGDAAWCGRGRIEVELVRGQSTLVVGWASSPLTLLTPLARARCVWTYTGNLGGGFVAGDQLRLDLRVGAGARVFLGSQSSTKIYQNSGKLPCGWMIRASVERGGLLVYAPDPVQAFAGAEYVQDQEFFLEADSGLVLLDWFTAGRTARGERWAFHRLHTRNAIWCAGGNTRSAPDFLDVLRLDASDDSLTRRHRLGRFNCVALLVLVGTPVRDQAARLLGQIQALPVSSRGKLVQSASPLPHGVLLRIAGEQVSAVSAEVRRHLSVLAPMLGDNPWERKL